MAAGWRFPTQDEVDQGFAAQEAELATRALHPLPRAPRDQDEREGGGVEPVAPRAPKVFCPTCGRIFDYGTKGMAVLQMKKHQRKEHADTVEAY